MSDSTTRPPRTPTGRRVFRSLDLPDATSAVVTVADVLAIEAESAAPDTKPCDTCGARVPLSRCRDCYMKVVRAAAPDAGLREAVEEVIALLDDRFGEDAPDEFYAWHERAIAALAAHRSDTNRHEHFIEDGPRGRPHTLLHSHAPADKGDDDDWADHIAPVPENWR